MNILAILIGLLVLTGIAYYVSRPLMRPQSVAIDTGLDKLTLEARRDSLYTQIKELDQDHATGKVNDDDFQRLRAELVAEAVEVLKQIDGAIAQPVPAPIPVGVTATRDDEVEALIAARRKTRSAVVSPSVTAPKTTNVDLEAAIAARRKISAAPAAVAQESAGAFCPKCGKPVKADDAFCAKCGAALQPQPAP